MVTVATFLLDAERRVQDFWERPVDLETLRPAIENALALDENLAQAWAVRAEIKRELEWTIMLD